MKFYLVFLIFISISGKSQISIEFLESPVMYNVGQIGGGLDIVEGAFKDFPKSLNRDSLTTIIQNELKKYPKGVLEQTARLIKIIVTDAMLISDEEGEFRKEAYGTYIVPALDGNYVFVDGTYKMMPAVLHHEISSVFLYELATSDTAFEIRTTKMLQYFNRSTSYYAEDEAIYNEIQKNQEWPKNNNNYFVLCNSGYALMDAENDFNEIVKCLFTPKLLKLENELLLNPSLKLWEFLDEAKNGNYEVYKKVMMVIDYYHAINPIFTEAYFRTFEK